jgi:hypothetical protein
VVPNYILFSVSTFRYEALRRDLRLGFARPWEGMPFGVDFAVVKTGSQGPTFTAARPERIMKAFGEDRFLAALYPVLREYPLPDGSVAALRVRRPAPLAGVAPEAIARRLTTAPERMVAGVARDPVGVRVQLDYEPDAIREGRARRVVVEADSARVGEPERRDRALLPLRDVRVVIDDLLFDAHRLAETGELAVLDARALRLERLTLLETDLREFLRGQRAGRGVTVALGEGAAGVGVTRLGPPMAMRVRLGPAADGRPFVLAVEDVRLGPVPVPAPLVDWITRHFDPTPRLRRLPVAVSIAPIRVRPGRLEVGVPP